MKAAILGLPQSGRTTLFKYLGELDMPDDRLPRQIVIKVPDQRLDRLVIEFESAKCVNAEVSLFDSVGNLESDGRTLETVRPADMVIWQLRGYSAGYGEPDPAGDYAILRELAMEKDAEVLKKRLENIEKSLSRGGKPDERKQFEKEHAVATAMIENLGAGKNIRSFRDDETGAKMISQYGLLTGKPALVHVSCDEDLYHDREKLLEKISSQEEKTDDICFIASMPRFEMELAELSPEDKKMFLDDAGITKSSKDDVLTGIFSASKQEVFLTAGPKESRAWMMKKGSTAVEAASVIHSDLAQGFIRAEIMGWDDYVANGSYKKAKELGKLRLEGREYIMKDGDITLFRFNI